MISIYYDSFTELEWFIELNPLFKENGIKYEIINSKGKNPTIIENLLSYDKPDIIVLLNDKPILVLEKTSEVPTGHNVGQRFARLVRSIEEGILTIYYFPFDARKHGEYSSICNLNIRLLDACFKIYNIHKTPLLTVNWLTDHNGELITDGRENERLIEILNDWINSNFDNNCNEIIHQLNIMKDTLNKRLQNNKIYENLPPSVIKYSTNDFVDLFKLKNVPESFLNKSFTYVYEIKMSKDKCKRQDPYTGTQFIYDYIVCRNGINKCDKINNLVLYFPFIDEQTWFYNNPNNINTKSCNWYLTASALLFSDNIYYNLI